MSAFTSEYKASLYCFINVWNMMLSCPHRMYSLFLLCGKEGRTDVRLFNNA